MQIHPIGVSGAISIVYRCISRTTMASHTLKVSILIMNFNLLIIIIIHKFLLRGDMLTSKKHNVGHSLVIVIIKNLLGKDIRITTMVNKSTNIPTLCSIKSIIILLQFTMAYIKEILIVANSLISFVFSQ